MTEWHVIIAGLGCFVGSVCLLFGLLLLCPPETRIPLWKLILLMVSGLLGALAIVPDELVQVRAQWKQKAAARRLILFGLATVVSAGSILLLSS